MNKKVVTLQENNIYGLSIESVGNIFYSVMKMLLVLFILQLFMNFSCCEFNSKGTSILILLKKNNLKAFCFKVFLVNLILNYISVVHLRVWLIVLLNALNDSEGFHLY